MHFLSVLNSILPHYGPPAPTAEILSIHPSGRSSSSWQLQLYKDYPWPCRLPPRHPVAWKKDLVWPTSGPGIFGPQNPCLSRSNSFCQPQLPGLCSSIQQPKFISFCMPHINIEYLCPWISTPNLPFMQEVHIMPILYQLWPPPGIFPSWRITGSPSSVATASTVGPFIHRRSFSGLPALWQKYIPLPNLPPERPNLQSLQRLLLTKLTKVDYLLGIRPLGRIAFLFLIDLTSRQSIASPYNTWVTSWLKREHLINN